MIAEEVEAIPDHIGDRFILLINDTPGVREVFGRFAIEAVPVTYTIGTASAGAGQRVGELIVQGAKL